MLGTRRVDEPVGFTWLKKVGLVGLTKGGVLVVIGPPCVNPEETEVVEFVIGFMLPAVDCVGGPARFGMTLRFGSLPGGPSRPIPDIPVIPAGGDNLPSDDGPKFRPGERLPSGASGVGVVPSPLKFEPLRRAPGEPNGFRLTAVPGKTKGVP